MKTYLFLVKASYGNDSIALIQWAHEQRLEKTGVLFNDTGWAPASWLDRIAEKEAWARSLGFDTHRTRSVGMEALVRAKKGWPRQGIQFCTSELKIAPTIAWLDEHDPFRIATSLLGVRREESANRAAFPEKKVNSDGVLEWAPLVAYSTSDRDALLKRAGVEPLPHRSMECFPCINSNRADLRLLAKDEARIAEIDGIERSMGVTKKGAPRTMFRPYRYQGATGIREIVRWAESDRGKFDLDDGNGTPGCEEGWCGL